jgi:hypothetical protein
MALRLSGRSNLETRLLYGLCCDERDKSVTTKIIPAFYVLVKMVY